jgi:hypothetical protein
MPSVRHGSEAVDVDCGQLVYPSLKDVPVIVRLHELGPVGGRPAGGLTPPPSWGDLEGRDLERSRHAFVCRHRAQMIETPRARACHDLRVLCRRRLRAAPTEQPRERKHFLFAAGRLERFLKTRQKYVLKGRGVAWWVVSFCRPYPPCTQPPETTAKGAWGFSFGPAFQRGIPRWH